MKVKYTKVAGKLEFLGGPVGFTAKCKGSYLNVWQPNWTGQGVDLSVTGKQPVSCSVDVIFGGAVYSAAYVGTVSAKPGKSGKFGK